MVLTSKCNNPALSLAFEKCLYFGPKQFNFLSTNFEFGQQGRGWKVSRALNVNLNVRLKDNGEDNKPV